MADKITKRMREFLGWMRDEGVVSMFPIVWASMYPKASKLGLIEECGREARQFGLTKFSLSEKGKQALQIEKFTATELRDFRTLVEGIESRDQLTRINARLQMKTFVEKTGKDKCDAMFEILKKEVADG